MGKNTYAKKKQTDVTSTTRRTEHTRRRTFALFYPTTPTVMLCAAGLYALSRRRRDGAVDDVRCVRWAEDAERNGRVGVVCRRWRSHAYAFARGTRSSGGMCPSAKRPRHANTSARTDLIQHQILPLASPPPPPAGCGTPPDRARRGPAPRYRSGRSPCAASG